MIGDGAKHRGADSAGAMMPNGDVLFAISPYILPDSSGNPQFFNGIQLDEYNPTTNTITVVGPNDINGNPISNLANTDKIMNDAFFVGVYPGLSAAMLDYMTQVFADFFKTVRGSRAA